jgi:predicted RNase H-like HicB family nuclease
MERPHPVFYYDDESHNWGFHVPGWGIVGGGATRLEAEQMAEEAIDLFLEDVRQDPEALERYRLPETSLATERHR